MPDMLFARIDEPAFRDLVAGRPAKLAAQPVAGVTVNLILADIGWSVMIDAIADAMTERMKGKSREDIVQAMLAVFGRKEPPR